jgi:Domain of unknown function (DUF6371)
MYIQPYLEPYKNIHSRHTCPSCGMKNSFTLYLDGSINKPINTNVGRCEKESKCGYHYTPRQFFIDNPPSEDDKKNYIHQPTLLIQKETPQPMGVLPFELVKKSASYESTFVRFLCEIMTTEQMHWIGEYYALGATQNGEVIFWQIDQSGKVRTGKIMQYNHLTGKRIKHENGSINWVHNKLKYAGKLPNDFNLTQCFFGEHLLKLFPNATIGIVESEKSAIIASVMMPDFIWLAAGNLNGLSIDKCKTLQGRKVILYPDLGAFEKWSIKATEIQKECGCKVTVSDILEKISTPSERDNGLDIADYIIRQHLETITTEVTEQRFSPMLQNLIAQNSNLLLLIDKIGLEEV